MWKTMAGWMERWACKYTNIYNKVSTEVTLTGVVLLECFFRLMRKGLAVFLQFEVAAMLPGF